MNFLAVFILLGFCVFALVVFEKSDLEGYVVLSSGELAVRPEQNYADCNLGQGLCVQYVKNQATTLLEHNR